METGEILLDTFFNSRDWVHRKVHIVDHLIPGRIQTKVTVDLTLPEASRVPQTDKAIKVLPVAMLSKGIIRSWQIRECGNSPLPVLNRDESTQLVRAMYISLLKRVGIPAPEITPDNDVLDFIDNSASSGKGASDRLLEYIRAHEDETDPAFSTIAQETADLLASSWIVFVVIPDSWHGRRVLIEYSYDNFPEHSPKPSLRKDNDYYEHSLSDPGFARSQHYEIRVPPELEFTETALQIQKGQEQVQRVVMNYDIGGCIAKIPDRFFADKIPRFGKVKLYYRLRPARQGILPFTVVASIGTTILIVLSALIRFGDLEAYLQPEWYESTSASVILAIPALLLSWVARTPEAAVVGRALVRLRWINIAQAMAVMAMAAALSTRWSATAWAAIWVFVYASMGWALVLWIIEIRVRRNKLAPQPPFMQRGVE